MAYLIRTKIQLVISAAILLSLPSNSNSETIISENGNYKEIDICLAKIINHPFTREAIPDILMAEQERTTLIWGELIDFCQCKTDSKKSLGEKKSSNWIPGLTDLKTKFETEDNCSLNKLSKETIHFYYFFSVATIMRSHLQGQLEGSLPSGSRMVASQSSIEDRLSCLEGQIMRKCTRIRSLGLTYRCINSTLSDPSKMDSMRKRCPNLTNEEVISGEMTI